MNQVISKMREDRQIWDVNVGLMLRHKAMQLKRLQATKESTSGLNNDLGITMTSDEILLRRKKNKGKVGRRDLPIINQKMHVDQEAERLPEI